MSSVLPRLGSAAADEKVGRTRLLLIGAVVFAVALGLWLGYIYSQLPTDSIYPVDLGVYRDGGLIVRQVSPPFDAKLPYPLYDWPVDNVALKFTYTPFAALCFALISYIPWSVLPRLTQWVSLACLLAAGWCTMGALGYTSRRTRLGGALLGAAAGLAAEPVLRTMYLGQINLVLMAVLIWDLRQPDRRWWKGFATGLAAGVKLVPLVFIPYLLLTRKFRAAAVASAGFAATVGLGFAILPTDSQAWWFQGLFYSDGRTGFVGWGGNQSLRGLTTRLAGSIAAGTVPWIVGALLATLIGFACIVVLDRAGHTMLGILSAALVGLLDSPISWDHHWVWVVPGIMTAAHYANRAWRAGRRRLAGGCGFLAAAILLIFAAWPGNLWSRGATGISNWINGLIWAGPNTMVTKYVEFGDQPWFAEYHWAGVENLSGNAYVLAGAALLLVLAAVAVSCLRGLGGVRGLGDLRTLWSLRPGSDNGVARGAAIPTMSDEAAAR